MTGMPPLLPPGLARAQDLKSNSVKVPNSPQEVLKFVKETLENRVEDDDGPDRCEALPGEPGMWLVALDVEGTLVPEAWLHLQQKTGLEELKLTTAHEPDYDKLMMHRIDVLRRAGIKLQDMKDVVNLMQPLPGCVEFLAWLQKAVPRVLLLTDTFEDYAMPLFEKLGYPSVFCHSLTINEEGYITGHRLRLRDQKRKAVEAFQRLNFRVIAIGDSFNDVSMMKAAEKGIFMNSSEKVEAANPQFPVCMDYEALKKTVLNIVNEDRAIIPRSLAPPVPLDDEAKYRSMWLMVFNVSGTLAPEPWPLLASVTGIDAFNATTADTSMPFSKIMKMRADTMRKHGIKLQKFYDILENIDTLPARRTS